LSPPPPLAPRRLAARKIRKKDILSGRRDDGESIIPIRSDRDELLLLLLLL
jgi:hypothetical protein